MSLVLKIVVLQGIFLWGAIASAWAAGVFVDNNDGTITDMATALMWQKSDDGTERTWDEAVLYCESLELADNTDWMLPRIHMLENLIDSSFSPTINPAFSVKPSYYWSSSESRASVKSAKYVNFFYGNTYAFSKDNTYYSICVKDISAAFTEPLEASLQFETSSEIAPFEGRFSSIIKGGTKPYFYEWDFGDGDFSSWSNPVHTFLEDGKYEIELTVSDNDGTIVVAKKVLHLPLLFEPDVVVKVETEVTETLTSQDNVAAVEEIEEAETQTGIGVGSEEIAAGIEVLAAEEEIETVTESPGGGIGLETATAEKVAQIGGLNSLENEAGMASTEETETVTAAIETVQSEIFEEDIPAEPRDEVHLLETGSEIISKSKEGQGYNETGKDIEKIMAEFPFEQLNEAESTVLLEQDNESVLVDKQEEAAGIIDLVKTGQETEGLDAVTETGEIVADKKSKGIFTAVASKTSAPIQMATGGQGLLAYSFVNALNGDADWNKDGTVTAQELKGYLGFAIDNLSGGSQEAYISMSDGDFPLCAADGLTQVMAIGIDSYREEIVEPLLYAGDSAEYIAQALTEKCSNFRKLVLTGQKTVRTNIFRGLLKMGKDIGRADNFIFYFAGSSVKSASGLNILTYDTLPELRGQTGIFFDDLTYLLENIPAANIIILFEAGPYVEQ